MSKREGAPPEGRPFAKTAWALWQGTIVFCLVLVAAGGRSKPFVWSPARWAAVGLWAAYLLAGLVSAASPRGAVDEVLRHGLYLMLFLGASEVVATAEASPAPAGASVSWSGCGRLRRW